MPIYICPISFDAPRVPVITNEGVTYDFVFIARSLLRENTNHHADFSPMLDPTTHGAIDTLIYNRSTKELNDTLMGEVLPLSHEEQIEVASFYTQLVSRYPRLKIYGILALEGMRALIGSSMLAVQLAPQRAVIAQSLWDAAGNGLLPVVKALLRAGAAINQAKTDGTTPLYIAAQNGHQPVVTVLLAAGAAINLTTTNGATPLLIASNQGHQPVVTALLAAGADINLTTTNGATPLFVAAQNGHLPVVTALLAAGADINQAVTDGATPLLFAAQNGHLPVVTALLVAGADINQTTTNGSTPLLIASHQGHQPVVTALLAAGAAINQAKTDGTTPLYTATLFGHFQIVRALQLQQHAIMVHSPISIATQNGYPAFVKALLLKETVRDYYLNQIIIRPELMREAFTQNPVFFTELVTHRNEFWARLRGPTHFNLTPDAHKTLLKAILNSRHMPDETQRHPLHALFSASQPTGCFSFFSRVVNITLDDIQAYTDATYPGPTPSIH